MKQLTHNVIGWSNTEVYQEMLYHIDHESKGIILLNTVFLFPELNLNATYLSRVCYSLLM